jgi:hypothetical protein
MKDPVQIRHLVKHELEYAPSDPYSQVLTLVSGSSNTRQTNTLRIDTDGCTVADAAYLIAAATGLPAR